MVISTVQVLQAVAFVVAAVVARRYGNAAQAAADAEVVRQGYAGDLLARLRIRFAETTAEMLFPLAIAAVLLALAALNATGSDAGRIATWILQPVLLVGGGLVTASQVFADRYVASAVHRAPEAAGVDAGAVVLAARTQFPSWLHALVTARFVLVVAGSLLVLALLLLGR